VTSIHGILGLGSSNGLVVKIAQSLGDREWRTAPLTAILVSKDEKIARGAFAITNIVESGRRARVGDVELTSFSVLRKKEKKTRQRTWEYLNLGGMIYNVQAKSKLEE
jgi:hypothetical protein